MTEKIIIDGELSCNNCLEKTRCKQQQEVKAKRIDAILSYIANEDNEKYITELKNEIPAITRCDVVLEKQLKHLEQENEKLKKQYNCYACDTCNGKEDYRNMKRHCENAIKTVHKYSSVLNEIRKIAEDVEDASSIRFYRIKRKINEVLNDT